DTDRIAIATHGGEFAGLGRLCHIEGSSFELGGMYVHSNYRSLGIARKIVRFLLENRVSKSTVYCLPFAHLQNFYEGEGFGEISGEDLSQVPDDILKKHRWCNETY